MDIIDKIKALPDGKTLLYAVMTGMQVEGYNSAHFTTDDLKALVAENQALRQKLNCIAFYAKDHDEPKSHCALCLIEGVVSGDILPIETAHGGNDE